MQNLLNIVKTKLNRASETGIIDITRISHYLIQWSRRVGIHLWQWQHLYDEMPDVGLYNLEAAVVDNIIFRWDELLAKL